MSQGRRLSGTALKLYGLSKTKVLSLARHYLACMTDNPYFPKPFPSLETIAAQIEVADAAHSQSMSKTQGTKSKADAEIRLLRMLLVALGRYVETTANLSAELADTIILSSGMDLKKLAEKTPRQFSVRQGPYVGSVILDNKAEKGCYYVYEMSIDPALREENWFRIYEGARVRFVKMGLEPGKLYYFRGRVLSRDGKRNWSVVISLMVA